MNWRFEWYYRLGLAVLILAAFWAVWASAQPTVTNSAASNETNTPGAIQLKLDDPEKKIGDHDLIFHLDRVEALRTRVVFGQPLWKFLSSLIYIVLAFYVAKFLDYITSVWLKRLAERTESKLDDLILETLRGPIKVIAFVILLHVGLTVFQWPTQVQVFLSKGLIIIVAGSITYVALKIVDLVMGLWRERTSVGTDKAFDEQLYPIIRKSVKLFVLIVAVLVTAQNLQINITGAIASLSIGGLAIGLAAQDTLANLFGAVAVYMDKPFKIGDRIKIESVEGTVETIGLRSTRVRNLDGHHVAIPNKIMGNAIITNVTRRPSIRTDMNLGLTYDTSLEKVKRATTILEEVFKSHPQTADLVISFNKFADSALNIFVMHVWDGTDQKAHFAALQELNLKVKERFDAEKIEFAFPTQTVYLKQG